MGKPVKIIDLAKSMVRLHGLRPIIVGDNEQPNLEHDEIAIKVTGLRPGEKLYEELLVNATAEETELERVFRAKDKVIQEKYLRTALEILHTAVSNNDEKAIKAQLLKMPLDYENEQFEPSGKQNKFNQWEIDQKQTNIDQQQVSSPNQNKFLEKINSRKSRSVKLILYRLLHKYFWFSRGMTLGVRVAIFDHEDRILLVKHSYLKGWHFPGGGVDHGENIYLAARREVIEETGLSTIENLKLKNVYFNQEFSNKDHIAFFTAQTSNVELSVNGFEVEEVQFFDKNNLPEGVDPSVIARLKQIHHGSEVSEVQKDWLISKESIK